MRINHINNTLMNKIVLTLAGVLGGIAAMAQTEEKPLLTIGCISDIHTERSLIEDINNIQLRGSFPMTVQKMREQEDLDVLMMGGDYTSDITIPQENWLKVREKVADAARGAFRPGKPTPVVYVAGNHDYEVANWDNLPKPYNAADFYTSPMKQDIGELAPGDCFYEMADNGSNPQMKLLAAYHYKIKGFHFVVLNCGKYFFKGAWNYEYSIESVQWVADKLAEIYADDPLKTVIFGIHVPFGDSNSISAASKGMVEGEAATLLKKTLAKYPNLIMLYGHDHGKDASYSREASSQRITLYDTNGNIMPTTDATHVDGEPLGENPVVKANMDCRLQSAASGKYLSWDTHNLCSSTTATVLTLVPGTTTWQIKFKEDSNGESLHIGSSGRYSKGSASNLYIYELTTSTKGTLISAPEVDKQYAVVAEYSGSYYALTDELYSGGSSSQRMVGTKVTLSSDKKTLTLGSANDKLAWTILSPAPAQEHHEVNICNVGNGKYLGFNQWNLSTQETVNECSIITTDAATSQFALYVNGSASDANGHYAISSSNGRFSANSNQYPTFFYRVAETSGGNVRAVKCSDPHEPGQYVIVAQNAKDATAYYAITSTDYSTGSSYRLEGLKVTDEGGTITIPATSTAALWNITATTSPEQGTASFFSAFMGSMRHYYNTIDEGDMPTETPNIVQAMIVYIYSDRVEMHLKNFNKTGTINGITVNPYLKPYISYREVAAETDWEGLEQAVDNPLEQAGKVGTGIGQYGPTAEYTALRNAALEMLSARTADAGEVYTTIQGLRSALATLTLNMPKAGDLLRIRSVKTGEGYVNGVKSDRNGGSLAVGEKGASSVFYYDGTGLLSYSAGQYLTGTSETGGYLTLGETGAEGTPITFALATRTEEAFTVAFGGRYLSAANSASYTGANNSEMTNGCNFTLESVEALPVSISGKGYATLYAPVALAVPEGVTAYTLSLSGDNLLATELEGVIPARTGVVISAAEGTYDFPVTVGGEGTSCLSGVICNTATPAAAVYTLADEDGIGFYRYAGAELKGFRAFLQTESEAKSFPVIFDGETAIGGIGASESKGAVYDLSGRRLKSATAKGVYIENGKKVLY